MIDFKAHTLQLTHTPEEIVRWEVWFQTPAGVTSNLCQAVTWCESRDLDPNMAIRPVPVAISINAHYEVLR